MAMELKKNPRYALENYSYLFLEIGLVLTLFITYIALEHKTYDHQDVDEFTNIVLNATEEEELVITHRVEPVKPPPPPPAQLTPIIEIVENDRIVEETILESTETDEKEAVEATNIELDDLVELGEGEEIIEDVPFAVIEEVPIFPGCKGNKQELRKCFSEKITRHIHKKFDINLASNLNLSSGKKRIFTVFTINHKGEIQDIKVRAPHPRLEKEGFRVINSLPKFIPGKQRGIPVKVKYALPITFEVVND